MFLISGDEAEKLITDESKSINVPFVALKCILAATDNFSEANKLGQGGFGPVYKVMTLITVLSHQKACLFISFIFLFTFFFGLI